VSATDWAWLAGGTGAAGTVTYFSCERPMINGNGHCAMPAGQSTQCPDPAAASDPEREIARLLAERDALVEIAQLRREREALLAGRPRDAATDYQGTESQ
jgi:hypothetical protein